MDSLGRLLELARIEGVVDYRCYLAGTFDIDHEPLPPDEAAYHLVIAGSGQVMLPDGSGLEIAAGDLLVFVRDGRHRVRGLKQGASPAPVVVAAAGPLVLKSNTDGDADLDLLCGRFVAGSAQGNMLFDVLPDVLQVRLADDHMLSSMAGLVDILRSEVTRSEAGASVVIGALSQALLVFVLRRVLKGGDVPPSLLSVMAEPRLGRALAAVLADPAREWTVALLAAEAAMSRATFVRHFEGRAGASPLEVVTRLRMDIACESLRRTNLPVGEIGEQVGYRSEASFSRAFAKATGQSPGRYRRGGHGAVMPSP